MSDGAGSSGAAKKNQMQEGRKKKPPGIEWEFALNVANRFIEWECKLCHVSKSGGAPRIREHFLGGPKKSCRVCTHPHAPAVAKRLREEFEKKDAKRCQYARVEVDVSQLYHGSNNHTPEVTPSRMTDPNEMRGTHVNSVSSTHPSGERNATMRQTSLQESFRGPVLEDAQLSLAQAIFYTGNAMVMVDSDHWKRAWKKIGEFGPGFSPPTYHSMRNDLLDKCYEGVKERVQRIILSNISLSGCTIVSDGWSNVQRRPLINVMVVSPRGETFVKAVDSSGMIKSGSYIADVLTSIIEEVGAMHVVQIVMDNAKNCRSAGRILKMRFPHIYPSGCNTHSLNLVLKDWYKSDDTTWFASIIDTSRKIVKFILKRQRVLDLYRSRMSVTLKLPAETRFCTYYYTLESLLRNRDAVVETFSCMDFHEWEKEQTENIKEKVKGLKASLNKSAWWKSVVDAYHVMMPVMYAIRNLDQRSPNLGKVWMTWWTVQRSLECPEKLKDSIVVKQWRTPFSGRQRKILLKYFHTRWVSAHNPLHSAAYLLDPEYWNLDLMCNKEVVQDFYKVVNVFYPNNDQRVKCIKQMTSFRLKEGLFANLFVQQMAKEQPAWKWWMMNGGEHYNLLRGLAMKILGQCAANSSSERNWSMYKYVHSTVRNRLLADRAEKLVYMFCNEKILQHIESQGYEEDMPTWVYDCTTQEEDDFDVGTSQCTLQQLDENLQVDMDEIEDLLEDRLAKPTLFDDNDEETDSLHTLNSESDEI